MQRTIVLSVAAVLTIAITGLGGFYVGRYVLESQSSVRVERLQDSLADARDQSEELVRALEAAGNDYSRLTEQLDATTNQFARTVQQLCAELRVEYPNPRDWIFSEQQLCAEYE